MKDIIMDKATCVLTYVLTGVLGIATGLGLGGALGQEGRSTGRLFEYKDNVKVFRAERVGRDEIYIEEEPKGGKFISLEKHLNKVDKVYDRTIEEAKIRKLVDW